MNRSDKGRRRSISDTRKTLLHPGQEYGDPFGISSLQRCAVPQNRMMTKYRK
mgnify:CR=1 FL=1